MNRSLATVTSGALGALARLDAAAQNLANVNTAGYKAERPEFRLRPGDAGLSAAAQDPIWRKTSDYVVEIERVRSFAQGPIRQTGNPLDVALTGDAFFVVNTPRGERYTRQGTFGLDGEGYLVTPDGDRVQGTSGDIKADNGAVIVAADGTVTVNGQSAGQLRLVSFGEQPALVAEGSGLFKPATPAVQPAPADPKAVELTQGTVEGANIDAVDGLLELVDIARGYEQYMKAIERLDQLTQRAINDVGRVG